MLSQSVSFAASCASHSKRAARSCKNGISKRVPLKCTRQLAAESVPKNCSISSFSWDGESAKYCVRIRESSCKTRVPISQHIELSADSPVVSISKNIKSPAACAVWKQAHKSAAVCDGAAVAGIVDVSTFIVNLISGVCCIKPVKGRFFAQTPVFVKNC